MIVEGSGSFVYSELRKSALDRSSVSEVRNEFFNFKNQAIREI